jgi:hypothetical protein
MRDLTRRLTRRRALALLLVTGLVAATATATAAGRPGLATALVGVLVAAVFATAVQLRWRLSTVAEVVARESRTTQQLFRAEIRELRSQVNERAWAEQLEVAQRRILAVVENERLAAADRQREVLTRIDHSVREVGTRQREQTRDVEALLQLYRDFRPRAPMPPSGRWALNAAGLLRLLHLIEQQQPKTILELGSGTSSVWIAYALERSGGRLVSVDHAPEFAELTRSMLAMHGLEHVAEVRHAPLRQLRMDGRDFRWYAAEAFTDLSEVGLLVVDGPPGGTGPAARYPALRELESRLSSRATVFLDDADRPDEQEILRQWTGAVPGLVRDRRSVDRHAVLTYSRC